MQVSFISLYDDAIKIFFERGVVKRAIDSKIINVNYINLRSFSDPPHYKVDDFPFSDRKGMLLTYDVLSKAIASLSKGTIIVCPDPKGCHFNHNDAKELSKQSKIAFISPAFEGVDDRIFNRYDVKRVSIGDIILSNGDSPSVMMAEAIVRYLPGVLGCSDCVENDSILSGLLEEPQFTAPRSVDGMHVPEILLSGNHKKIKDWKLKQQLLQTLYFRPDLINEFKFNKKLVTMVDQIVMEDIV